MRARSIIENLFEASLSKPVLIVDVQPTYDDYCSRIMPKLADFINTRRGPIVAYFNGYSVTDDSKESVIEYYLDNGVDEEVINRIDFKEKDFGFLRNWIDHTFVTEITTTEIIKAIRLMARLKVSGSKDVTEEQWKKEFPDDYEKYIQASEDIGSIYLPSYISVSELKALGDFLICGGHSEECLREITLICDAFNIKYTEMRDLIY